MGESEASGEHSEDSVAKCIDFGSSRQENKQTRGALRGATLARERTSGGSGRALLWPTQCRPLAYRSTKAGGQHKR